MPPDELRSYLRAQPFQPFRLHLTDGRSFDVRHPDMAIVTPRTVYVGVYDPAGAVADKVETIALIHVVSAEPIPLAA